MAFLKRFLFLQLESPGMGWQFLKDFLLTAIGMPRGGVACFQGNTYLYSVGIPRVGWGLTDFLISAIGIRARVACFKGFSYFCSRNP